MPKMTIANEGEHQRARQAVVGIARHILNGSIGIVEGSRLLLTVQRAAGAEDDANFMFFVGVNSQTDHLPVGDVRRHWNADALRLKDVELNEFETEVRARALEVCRKLIEKYDRPSQRCVESKKGK